MFSAAKRSLCGLTASEKMKGQAACRELEPGPSSDSVSSSARGDTSGGGMPPKASAAAWSQCRTVSRVCSRRSTATTLANREGSPVTTDAAECSQARPTGLAPAMAFDRSRLRERAVMPRFPAGIGSAASISFARHWHQMMTSTNTVNPSAKSTRGAVTPKTRTSRSDPIATPHATAPVRRRGSRSAGSAARRRHHPTAPALATLLRSDNDAQATERGLVASIQRARYSHRAWWQRVLGSETVALRSFRFPERQGTLTTRVVGRVGVSDG